MANKALLGKLADAGVMTHSDAMRMADYKFPPRFAVRGFQGAQVSNLTAGWASTPKPIDVDIRNGLRKLRARSRHEAQNNDYVRRFFQLCKTNVIGANGIQMQARVTDVTGTQDKLANDAIETGWEDWGKKQNCEVSGKFSWRMVQRLSVETLMRDGEILIRRVKNFPGNKYLYALQLLDTELLDVDYNGQYNGNVVRMGVELDAWRKPVAYHLRASEHTTETYESHSIRYLRIPAAEILHEFLPEWIWQTRGIPAGATALLRMNMLSGYEDAELVASRVSASKFGVYERTGEDVPVPVSGGAGMATGTDATGNFVQDVEPGMMEVLPDGYRLNYIDPQHPNAAYQAFVKTALRGIAAGLGVSYNSLANDLEGVNYSSLRQGAIEDRDVWMALQDWFVESVCEPVFAEWLLFALSNKTLVVYSAKAKENKPLKIENYDKFNSVVWQPRRWQWVDPEKELNAHQLAFNNKLRSPQSVIRDMGGDPENVLNEWVQWQEMLASRNLKTEPATPAGSSFGGAENATDQTANN